MMRYYFFLLMICLFPWRVVGEVEEYILQPGDVISVNVVEHPEFSGRHKIRPDGRINYPVIGEIDVATLTCAQLVKIMQGKLSSYVNNPVVSVSIEAYYANKIYVIGAVTRGGEYQIYEPIDLMKAVAMCGGLKNSKVKGIKIIRSDGTIIAINTAELWGTAKYDTKKYILYPGDTMFVPDSFEVPWGLISVVLNVISVSLQIVILVTRLSS
ncbi:MAG: polysaccharide export protein [Chitinispirillaceae bacterium]|nr:polysaccharide export protein [Chitinispirillaceae bacterium]